jgi:hypothetical protein
MKNSEMTLTELALTSPYSAEFDAGRLDGQVIIDQRLGVLGRMLETDPNQAQRMVLLKQQMYAKDTSYVNQRRDRVMGTLAAIQDHLDTIITIEEAA